MMTEMTFCLKEILYTVPLTCLFVFNAMKVDCLYVLQQNSIHLIQFYC